MKTICLFILPNRIKLEIADRLGVDPDIIETSRPKENEVVDIIGLMQMLNASNPKTFDEFTDEDWEKFTEEHIDEIINSIDYRNKFDVTSVLFNLDNNNLSQNDYISFVKDNSEYLNKQLEVTEENRKIIFQITQHPIFKLFGQELGKGFFNKDNIVYLSFFDLNNSYNNSGVNSEDDNIKNRAIKSTTEKEYKNPVEKYKKEFMQVMNTFKKFVVKDKNFETNHIYYIIADQQGREFIEEDYKNGKNLVAFTDLDENKRYGIPVDKSVTGLASYNIDEDFPNNPVSPVLGNNFDDICRKFFKGEKLSLANFGQQKVEYIKGQLELLKKNLDDFFKDKGGYEVITDEFPIASYYYDSKGTKHYIAGTMDMVVIGGDGSVYIFDFKTHKINPGKDNNNLLFKPTTLLKYKRQLSIYKEIINNELTKSDLHIEGTGLIVCEMTYPQLFVENELNRDYKVSDKKLISYQNKPLSKNSDFTVNVRQLTTSDSPLKFIHDIGTIGKTEFSEMDIKEFESLTPEEMKEITGEIQDEYDLNENEAIVVDEALSQNSNDYDGSYQQFVDENQPIELEKDRPVSNTDILKIGRATVKYVTHLANIISKDNKGNVVRQILGEKYTKAPDGSTNLPLYGKPIQEILSTDDIYKTMFKYVIFTFFNNDEMDFDSFEFNRNEWIKMNYFGIMNSSFAELKMINGLRLNPHTRVMDFSEYEDNELDEVYEIIGEMLEQGVEAYDIDKRTVEAISSMPTRIKQRLSTMLIKTQDNDGNIIPDTDEYGLPKFLDMNYVVSQLYVNLHNIRSKSGMIEKMRQVALNENFKWMNQVVDMLDESKNTYDEQFSQSFFKTFRKSKNNFLKIYEEQDDDKSQKERMVILGSMDKALRIVDNINSFYMNGGKTDLFSKAKEGNDTLDISKDGFEDLNDIRNVLRNHPYDSRAVRKLLELLGIDVDNENLINGDILRKNKSKIGKAIFTTVLNIITDINKQNDDKIKLSTLSPHFTTIAKLLSFAMDEQNDVSQRDNDKNYQRFTEPSFIQDMVDAIQLASDEEIDAILNNSKYTRFRQFSRQNGEGRTFICSWLNEIKQNKELRKIFKHYIHTSTNDTQYMKLGDKDYVISLIKGFFAPQEAFNQFGIDEIADKGGALFWVPILSDKNSQEWIQFIPITFKDNEEEFYKEFSKRAYEYLLYEIERMRSVLYHLRHGEKERDVANFNLDRNKASEFTQYTEEDVFDENGIKINRIKKFKELTFEDILDENGKIKKFIFNSGMVFKYLPFLNSEFESKTEFGRAVLALLNEESSMNSIYDKLKGKEVTVKERKENARTFIENNFNELFKNGVNTGFNEFMKNINSLIEFNELKSITSEFQNLNRDQIYRKLRWMYYNNYIAAMNITNLTVTDPSFYKNPTDFQKRFSQVHSQTQRLDKENTFFDGQIRRRFSKDGKFRFVIINDEIVSSDLKYVVKKVFTTLADTTKDKILKQRYQMLSKTLPDMFDVNTEDGGVNVTDGQGYNSPTSLWKKMGMLGELNPLFNEAYEKIRQGDFALGNINIVLQSLKPFVYGFSEQFDDSYIGSDNNTKLVPVQIKDSESLIILAGAIMEGAEKLGVNTDSPLKAIYELMENSAFKHGQEHSLQNYNGIGIDTVVFKSGVKGGSSGVLDIAGKTYKQIKDEFAKIYHTDKKGKVIKDEEGNAIYDDRYVHEMDFDSYGIQQNVPAHMQDHEQPLGSQMAVLDFTDMPEDVNIVVPVINNNGTITNKTYTKSIDFIRDYNTFRKEDFGAGIHSLMTKFGCTKVKGVYQINKNKFNLYLSKKLSNKIVNDSKYTQELYRAFSTLINRGGHYEFLVPIGDPSISNVVYSILFTEIKDAINKENVPGGPVVQMSPFGASSDLHIKDSEGNVLHVKNRQIVGGFKPENGLIFEAYITCPTSEFEKKITKEDGTLMTMDEIKQQVKDKKISLEEFDNATKFIAYRIPTEDKYSIYRCEVKGFIPRQEGELIILPKELTTLSGTDFDIDKMYCWFKKSMESIIRIKDTDDKARLIKRNNMFNYHWAAAGDWSSVEKQLFPGGYQELKDLANQVSPDFKSGNDNIFFTQTQMKFRRLNAAGKNFVGIAALNNVCHGLSSFCKLGIKDLPEFTILFDDANEKTITVSSTNLIDNETGLFTIDSVNSKFDGSRISRTLSMFVGASADNAKEALLGALNITPTTAGYAMTLIRMGFPIKMVVYMMNNPLIKKLSQDAENSDDSFEKAISQAYHKYGSNQSYTISERELTDRIKENNNSENKDDLAKHPTSVDKAVLKLLYDISSISMDMSLLNTILSLNSIKNAIGPTITDALKKQMQIYDFIDKVRKGDSSFDSQSWTKIKEGLPFIEHLIDCYDFVIKTLTKTFSPIYEKDFLNILTLLYQRGFNVTEKNITNLVNAYLLIKSHVAGIFGKLGNTKLIYGFVNGFIDRKQNYQNNDFVRSLYIENMLTKVKIPSIKYRNSGMNRAYTDDMSASWAQLTHGSEAQQNLSDILFEYMITRCGFSWMPYSSASIAPMEVKLSISDKESGHTYRDLFAPDLIRVNGFIPTIIDQFARNNPRCGMWQQVKIELNDDYVDANNVKIPLVKFSELSGNPYGVASKYFKDLYRPETTWDDVIDIKGVKYVKLRKVERLGVDNNFMEYDYKNPNLETVVDVNYSNDLIGIQKVQDTNESQSTQVNTAKETAMVDSPMQLRISRMQLIAKDEKILDHFKDWYEDIIDAKDKTQSDDAVNSLIKLISEDEDISEEDKNRLIKELEEIKKIPC